MEKDNNIVSTIGAIYRLSAIKRSIIIWVGFQVMLWGIFSISYFTNQEAWVNVLKIESVTVGGWWSTFLFIIFNNFIICFLIIAGNMFVRFNVFTPGLLVLIIQVVMIGWLAGSNGFEVPFTDIGSANIQYFRIGLWETTAYALACAITLPKSLLIADTFPANKWSLKRKIKDINFSFNEICILLFGVIVLIIAAIIETFVLVG